MHQHFCHRYWTDYSTKTIDGTLKFSNLKSVILIRFRTYLTLVLWDTVSYEEFLIIIPALLSEGKKKKDQKRFKCFNSLWPEDSGIDSAEQSSKWTKLSPLNELNVVHSC